MLVLSYNFNLKKLWHNSFRNTFVLKQVLPSKYIYFLIHKITTLLIVSNVNFTIRKEILKWREAKGSEFILHFSEKNHKGV